MFSPGSSLNLRRRATSLSETVRSSSAGSCHAALRSEVDLSTEVDAIGLRAPSLSLLESESESIVNPGTVEVLPVAESTKNS
jgi:hypothetical protein